MTDTTASVLGTVAMLLLQPILIGLTIYIVYRLVKGRSTRAAEGPIHSHAEGGKPIPVMAAFYSKEGDCTVSDRGWRALDLLEHTKQQAASL